MGANRGAGTTQSMIPSINGQTQQLPTPKDDSREALPRRAMAGLHDVLNSLKRGSESDLVREAVRSLSFMPTTSCRPFTKGSCEVCMLTSWECWKRSNSLQITGLTYGVTKLEQLAGRLAFSRYDGVPAQCTWLRRW